MIHALEIAGYIFGGILGVIGVIAVWAGISLFRQWNKPNGYNG